MKAAAIYARVSTTDQVKGTSLDGQVEACKQYAEQHGYKVAKVVREDLSGAILHRPGLDDIRDMVARGEIDALIVFDPDRLSRSLAHLMLLTEEFEQRRADLVFVNAPREETPEGKMLFGMRGLFAEYERTKIAERTRRGKERRAREGKLPGGALVPFGYSFTPGTARFEIDEREASWVQRIFEWLVYEGCSLREITHRLDDAQVPTKRGGVCWHRSTVQSILRNGVYCGDFYWNKTQAVVAREHRNPDAPPKRQKSAQSLRPREEWIRIETPAIVDRELFESAQRRLRRNKEIASGRSTETQALFKGLLVCAQCGLRLGAHTLKASGAIQYGCPGRRQRRYKDNCRCGWFLATRLERKAWAELLEVLSDKDRILGALALTDQIRADERRRADAELESLLNTEAAVKRERNRLLDLHLAEPPLVDLETFRERSEVLDKKQRAISEALSEARERMQQRLRIEASRAAVERQCEQVAAVRRGLKRFSEEEKRMFVEGLELRGVVDGHKIKFTGIFGELPLDLTPEGRSTVHNVLLL